MKHKQIIWLGFVLMVLAQLFFPAQMVFQKENVLTSGQDFEFRTAPIDPIDPFRGKYVTLGFEDDVFSMERDTSWKAEGVVYLEIEEDHKGFAKIKTVSRSRPTHTEAYFETTIRYIDHYGDEQKLHFYFPFDRFYMEEFKAPVAEERYRESLSDPNLETTALVSIKNGQAVLKDVLVNGKPLEEMLE